MKALNFCDHALFEALPKAHGNIVRKRLSGIYTNPHKFKRREWRKRSVS